jgi:hypothetical protein
VNVELSLGCMQIHYVSYIPDTLISRDLDRELFVKTRLVYSFLPEIEALQRRHFLSVSPLRLLPDLIGRFQLLNKL